jgi:zinc transport system permease protein
MIEPYLLRALVAGLVLVLIAAPLGSVVVWNRMSYLGETMAQASLLGIALGLLLKIDMTLSVLAVTVAAAFLLISLTRQQIVTVDSVLGLLHHGFLALGIIAIAAVKGQSVDLIGYLFGDIFAVSKSDLIWISIIALVVIAAMTYLWSPLIRLALHEDLARAEGVNALRIKTAFALLLALTIAVAIKVVGILLAIAVLIVPAIAARPFSKTPEGMVLVAAIVGAAGVLTGLGLSLNFDVPGGPAIVLVMTVAAATAIVAHRVLQPRG